MRSECQAHAADAIAGIPARKPAKATPTRAVRLLVFRDPDGRVLLERRVAKGVWQGLWSVPEAADDDAAKALRAALDADDGTALPAFLHAFSHYRLQASPILHRVREARDPGAAHDHRWVTPADYDALGLPRPIRTLLESLP
jgi:A/G-specific adenine glycosylase